MVIFAVIGDGTRPMHIMLLILPIMLCSNSLPLALLCPKILPIML